MTWYHGILMFIVMDFGYYWAHRMGHEVRARSSSPFDSDLTFLSDSLFLIVELHVGRPQCAPFV